MRTCVYVDGFNLFYRALKKTPYKWLDLRKLFSLILSPQNQIVAIKYFTALVSGRQDAHSPIRQQTYLRALQAHIPELSIIQGHFLSHVVRMPLAVPRAEERFVEVVKTEEKGSDVNLAVQLVNDAWLDRFDCAVLVSNDSDLAEAARIVRDERGKTLGILIPGGGPPSKELIRNADFVKAIRVSALASSQLPQQIPNTNLRKPADW